MLAMPGTRLGAVPHPCTEPSTWVLLVEGPPDMISARSRGLPAIAVPGDHAWEGEWTQLLAGRRVSIVMDCDDPGREAARQITGDLKGIGVSGSIIDLDPRRQDGYDLTDWQADRERLTLDGLRVQLGAATGTQGGQSQPGERTARAQAAGCSPPTSATASLPRDG